MSEYLTTQHRRFLATTVAWLLGFGINVPANADGLDLTHRRRVESPGLGGASRVLETVATWNPKRTGAIVCDMWDLHHCLNAVRREVDMAPRMEAYLKALRRAASRSSTPPSSCMDAYANHPARRRALDAPRSKNPPAEIESWCKRIPNEEQGVYPVDQTDGGEDDDLAEHASWAARLKALGRNPKAPWKSQIDVLTIDPERDYISDDGREIWSILEDRGIENVLLMGVHLNMCVLGRPFGLRQMAKNGKTVAVVRDLTDTMYNPLKAPFVSHFNGTDRVVEHVERFVCPSVTSDQVLGGAPFRFRTDLRPRIVFLIAEDEYKTESTLPPFASHYLAKDYKIDFVFDAVDDKNSLTGSSVIADADILFISARRRAVSRVPTCGDSASHRDRKVCRGHPHSQSCLRVTPRRRDARRTRRLADVRRGRSGRPLHQPPQSRPRREIGDHPRRGVSSDPDRR